MVGAYDHSLRISTLHSFSVDGYTLAACVRGTRMKPQAMKSDTYEIAIAVPKRVQLIPPSRTSHTKGEPLGSLNMLPSP